MHGPAGPFPGARDRRTLQRRAARAHRGAQAQARPLLRANCCRSHSGGPRGPDAGNERPGLGRGQLSPAAG